MSIFIERLKSSAWTQEFTSSALAKARAYAADDRVEIIEIDDRKIEAFCVGSQDQAYEQTIYLSEDRLGSVSLRCLCTCPVAIDCKHCAAVLYHLQGIDHNASESDAQIPLGRALEHWLSTIPVPAKPAVEGAQTAGTRLFYKLKPTSVSGKWLLDIFKVSQLKSGELREVKPMYSLAEMLMRQPGYLSELDLRVARLLVAMHSHHAYYSGYPLEGSSGAELLDMLLRTSRLFLDFEDLRPLVSGAKRTGQFAWAEQADGGFRAQWSSAEAAQETVLALEPLYYLDREQRQIGPLFNELEEKLASHLTLAPDVPARQAMQFSHRMSTATRIPPPHQLTERVIDDVLPQPQLTLVSGRERSRWEYVLEHRAALVFTYNGQPTVDRNPEVMILNGTETQRIQRQPAVEKQLRQILQKHGFKKDVHVAG
jgi:hypothetical protein